MRMSLKQHKNIFLNEKDTILLSSSIIPGNEISVRRLEDNLYRHDLKIIHYRTLDVHSTGHGNAQELAWINKGKTYEYLNIIQLLPIPMEAKFTQPQSPSSSMNGYYRITPKKGRLY